MTQILLVVHLLIAIAMVVTILLQRSEGGALGIGGGGGGGGGMGLFSARGTANALSRTTAILAVCFFITSIGLALLAGGNRESGSILDAPAVETPVQPAEPAEPSVPLSQ